MSPTLITIWLSFACWWLAMIFKDRTATASAWLSTAGIVLLWTHLLLAYQVDHGGSQLAAIEHTGQVLSLRGMGFVAPAVALGVNWIFAGCWSLDVILKLMTGNPTVAAKTSAPPATPVAPPHSTGASRWRSWGWDIWQLFFFWLSLFIWFNATVVFANTPFRWVALLLFVGIALRLSAAYIEHRGKSQELT